MPRFRSLSTNTAPPQQPSNRTSPASSGTSSPALLARGFRSLRRARRQSTSVPSSPMPVTSQSIPQSEQQQEQQQEQEQPNVIPLQQYSSAPISTSSFSQSISSSPEEEIIEPPTTQEQQPNSRRALTSSEQQHEESTTTTHGPHIRLVPNVGISNRCFVFDIIDRSLEPGVMLKIGRYSDRNVAPDRLSFKSKVVSRSHAELWVSSDSNKIYIRDVGSSSGTFVNRARLSPAGVRSSAQEIKDGDLIQLGVDYQGGIEPMYRAVRMRLEVNREPTISHPFSRTAFQQLRSHLLAAVAPGISSNRHDEEVVADHNPHHLDGQQQQQHHHHHHHHQPYPNNIRQQPPHSILLDDHSDDDDDDDEEEDEKAAIKRINVHTTAVSASPHATTVRGSPVVNQSDIQECCICLYAIAPLQALFIAPCSHIFHFKCLRPILFQNYPGFSCPICRTYSDLEASVAVEVSEVLETLGLSSSAPPKVGDEENEVEEQQQQQQQQNNNHPLQHDATVHGDGCHTDIQEEIIEESGHEQVEQHDHYTELESDNERGRIREERVIEQSGHQPSTRSSSEFSHRSRPSQRHQHADVGILSTTLVATPPTFEEMLTASSMSSSH